MDSVAKGDALENETFTLLQRELENGELGIVAASAKIFQKKRYFSRDREKDIIVDISIEVWPPGAENYAILWICECKNYGHKVPVDDVEEFKAKLDQIAGKNVKGVIVTKNSFQSGAVTFAKNQGIGLARVMPKDQIQWIMHYSSEAPVEVKRPNLREFRAAFFNQNYQSEGRSFYSSYDGYLFENWRSLLAYSFKGITND